MNIFKYNIHILVFHIVFPKNKIYASGLVKKFLILAPGAFALGANLPPMRMLNIIVTLGILTYNMFKHKMIFDSLNFSTSNIFF